MPEVRVQLSDEQVEQLREYALKQWVSDDVVDLLADAVREQLPPPIKVGDKVRATWLPDEWVYEVRGIEDGWAWLRRVSDGVYQNTTASMLVRVEEGE